MIKQQITGYSKENGAAALGQALAAAGEMGDGAASVTVIVQKVAQVNGAWVAYVNILVEPKVRMEAATPETAPTPARKENEKKQEVALEVDLAEKQKAEREHIATLEHEKQLQAQEKARQDYEQETDALFHLYIESGQENFFRPIAGSFNYDYVHVIPEGALWEQVQNRHPDIEFYEAAHPSTQNASQPEPAYERRASMRPGGYRRDLTPGGEEMGEEA